MESRSIWQFIKEAFKRGTKPTHTVDYLIVPALLGLVLLLPPVSITSRLSSTEAPKAVIASADVKVEMVSSSLPSGTQIRAVVDNRTQTPLDDGLSAISPLFRIEVPAGVSGAAKVTLPLQAGTKAADTIDLYTLDNSKWTWVSGALFSADGAYAVAETKNLPETLIAVKTVVKNPSLAASLAKGSSLDDNTKDNLAVLNPEWHTIKGDGTLAGPLGELPKGKFSIVPVVSNKGTASYDAKVVESVLSNDATRKANINNIATLATQNFYAGVEIDYQAVPANLKGQMTSFVTDLATELHKSDRKLSVIVPSPIKTDTGMDTGAYDLSAIGAAADVVKIRPTGSRGDFYSTMPTAISYVTGQVDRRKVQIVISADSQDKGTADAKNLAYKDALKLGTAVEIKQPASIAPGKTLTFLATNLLPDNGASGIKWDGNAKSVSFTYKGNDGSHTVFVENAFSAAYRLQLARQYNLRGVALESAGAQLADSKISDLFKAFTDGNVQLSEPNSNEFVPAWSASEGPVEASSGAWANWTIPTVEGDFQVNMSVGDGVTRVVGSKSLSTMPVVVVAKPTAAPTTGTTTQPTPKPAATPTSAPVIAPAPATGRYPGVSYGMCIDNGNNMDRAFALTKQAGFGWAKFQLRWESLESSKGNINWGVIDDIVNRTSAAGLRLIVSVVTAPAWARPADTDWNVPGPPANPQDFADFVGAIAARHKGKVHAYEIWNEQNLWYEWGGRGKRLNAGQYVNLLKSAYATLKATDPGAVVVSGALTPTGFNDGDTAYDDVQFMQLMYAAGLKNYCDAVGVHANVVQPYAADLPPGQSNHASFYFRRFEQIRAIMVQSGDSNKQIWFTEFGWPSSSSPHPDYPAAREISEEQQAAWLVQGYEIARARGYIGLMAVWNLNYGPIAEADDRYAKKAFGILNPDWSARPAFSRLAAMPK